MEQQLQALRKRFSLENPNSRQAHTNNSRFIPSGVTRAVLYYKPFPITLRGAKGSLVFDIDDHQYTDFVGEYSAGLFGHYSDVLLDTVTNVVKNGISLGAPNLYEGKLAQLLCKRFDSIEQIRFCNSGTEANMLALSLVRAVTCRNKVLVFKHGYHGSVFYYAPLGQELNVPYQTIVGEYNNVESAQALIEENADDLAAVLVEPMLGSGGLVPASHKFLQTLRTLTEQHNVILIFDEVLTSRLSPGGLQQVHGIKPDLTTLGKYLGGGLTFGAFGGKTALMEKFDISKDKRLYHGGTFNNNVLTMAAGYECMARLYQAEVVDKLNLLGDRLRDGINAIGENTGLPVQATGLGSLINIHFHAEPIVRPYEITSAQTTALQCLHLAMMLDHRIFMTPRGFLTLSIAHMDDDIALFCRSLESFLETYGDKIMAYQL